MQGPPIQGVEGPAPPTLPRSWLAQQEHREDSDRKMEQPERRSASGQDAEVVRVTKDRRQG